MRLAIPGAAALLLAGACHASAEALRPGERPPAGLQNAVPQAEPQPVTIFGKCAKQAGAPYDPVRQGWYTKGPVQAYDYRQCLMKNIVRV